MNSSPVCAVVVSYWPSSELLKKIEILCQQVVHVAIIDNTPGNIQTKPLDAIEQLDKVAVIRNSKNLGVAAALNIGIRYAIARGFRWIFTFDQDSQISTGFVEAMLCSHEEASKRCSVGLVFPLYIDAQLGHALAPLRSANGSPLVCMTSGALINASIFTLMGPMESEFVIDSVDHEYCLRMRSLGFQLWECSNAVLLHSLGNITFHNLAGRQFATTNHGPNRRYYITRNRLVLMKRYILKDPEWVMIDLHRFFTEAFIMFLFERDRLRKAALMLRAAFDAVLNRLGPRVEL